MSCVASYTPKKEHKGYPRCSIFWDIETLKEWMRENEIGPNTVMTDMNNRTLLHVCAEVLHYSSELLEDAQQYIQQIIHLGFDVNARTKEGLTPLHYAAKLQNLNFIIVLLKNGADIEAKSNILKGTPLYLACLEGSVKSARMLLDYGANINAVDYSGCPIIFNERIVSKSIIELLLEYGVNLDYEDNYGRRWDSEGYSCASRLARKTIKRWLDENFLMKEPC